MKQLNREICTHCRGEFERESLHLAEIDGKELLFCCKGCQSVYMILKSQDLMGFYDRLADNKLQPIESRESNFERYDSPSFERFLRRDGNKIHLALILSGIHCAACIWLIEKMLILKEDIIDVNINYTNNKLKLVCDSSIKLSEIMRLIHSIGYSANIYDPKLTEETQSKESKKMLRALVVGLFCTMNIMWIAIAQWAGYFLGISETIKMALHLAGFALSTPTLFYTGRFFYQNALRGLKQGIVGMDLLVSTGASLTYIYSIYASFTNKESYFEAVAMIVTFVFAGKFFESKMKRKAGEALDELNFMLPSEVIVLTGNSESKIAPESVQIGSKIKVLPNDIVPIDGVLESKSALLDTQNINGESTPQVKKRGEEILSFSQNAQNSFVYTTTAHFSDSLFFKLINTLEDSLTKKPKIQNLANSLSQKFSQSVLGIALLGYVIWNFIDSNSALDVAISVIIISCPCALALATPIASVVGITRAYKNGVIFKEARSLESLSKCNVVVFDKTGTLTKGQPKVSKEIFLSPSKDIALSLAINSTHPISLAIARHIDAEIISFDSFEEVPGLGVIGKVKDAIYFGGSIEFMELNGFDIAPFQDELKSGYMNYAIGMQKKSNENTSNCDKSLLALFLLEDEIKENANKLISYLKKDKRVIILSGDNSASVEKVAKRLKIDEFYGNMLPQGKSDFINSLDSKVVMIGDGINDILAMQHSAMAITLGDKSAINKAADIICPDNMDTLEQVFTISSSTMNTIKQNIAISIVYNACVIPLALLGFVIPLFAAISMSLSSILVVLNSLRAR